MPPVRIIGLMPCYYYLNKKHREKATFQGGNTMKEMYITITGFNHYYGATPFKIGKKIKCIKEPDNPYDSEAIRAVIKSIGTVGYLGNSPYTAATGTMSAGRIWDKVGKKFWVQVMFITQSKVICKVLEEKDTLEV